MLNQIVIMGRMVRDPELRRTGTGTAVASFTLAVDRDFAPKDGGEKETDFIECVAWKNTAEFVSKYFGKGRMAVVAGRLQVRKWKNKEGENRYTTEVLADNVYFGDSKKDTEQSSATAYGGNYGSYGQQNSGFAAPASSASDFAMLDDDDANLPF